MTYPNLIFINQVFDKYISERVEKSSSSFFGSVSNAFTSITSKSNNLLDVSQKLSELSRKCSEANLLQDEVQNAVAWVDNIIRIGEAAFLLENHKSHNVLHMLRTYLLYCAETWPELKKQINLRITTLNAQHQNIERAIINAQDAKSISSNISEEFNASPRQVTPANTVEAKDEYTDKSLEELRLDRDKIIRKLVYLGDKKIILKEDIGFKKLFPHLSITDKIKPTPGFTLVKTLPLELHDNYYLFYCRDTHAQPLNELVDTLVNEHNFKWGKQQPVFLNQAHHQPQAKQRNDSPVDPEKNRATSPLDAKQSSNTTSITQGSSFNPVGKSNPIPIPMQSPHSRRGVNHVSNTPSANNTPVSNITPLSMSSFAQPSVLQLVPDFTHTNTGSPLQISANSNGQGGSSGTILQTMLTNPPVQTATNNSSSSGGVPSNDDLIDGITDEDESLANNHTSYEESDHSSEKEMKAQGLSSITTGETPVQKTIEPPSPSNKIGRTSPTHFQPPPPVITGDDTTEENADEDNSNSNNEKKGNAKSNSSSNHRKNNRGRGRGRGRG